MGQTCESRGNKKQLMNNNNANQVLFQCKSTRDKIDAYIKTLETKEKLTKEKAKECLRKKDRDRAKFYLKGCKAYQNRIKIAEGKLDMIEEQIINIENAQTSKDTLTALQQGNQVLRELNKEVKIEDLENMKQDLEELKDNDKEIGDFLKEKANEDIAECNDEFEQLVKEVQSEQINNKNQNQNITNNNNKINNLPQVPNNAINAGIPNNKINQNNINNKQIIKNNV